MVLDIYAALFTASVAAISLAVICFSTSYMSHEKFYLRFHLLVIRFVASMLLLIRRPNLIRILLGWDGLGVTSYLLVIYFQRGKSSNAGILTILSNRVGDVLFLLAIGLFLRTGS